MIGSNFTKNYKNYFRLSIFALFSLSFFFNKGIALCRDYCTFYECENGVLSYDDLEYMDDNNDYSFIYGYSTCINHFNRSYHPYWNPSLDKCLPKIERKFLYQIPDFKIPGYELSKDFYCSKFIENEKCGNPVIYPGYLDIDFHFYDPFLEEQLTHYDSVLECICYWPEHSKEAGKTSDLAYLLFRDLFLRSALSDLIDNPDEQRYLLNNFFWNLNIHGLSVSCVCKSFWFSHYYRVCLQLLKFAEEDYAVENMTWNELNYIRERINKILLTLAHRFEQVYLFCLQDHPSKKIAEELGFLRCIYFSISQVQFPEKPSILSWNSLQIGEIIEDQIINDRSLGTFQPPCGEAITLSRNHYYDSNKFFAEYYLYQGLYNNDVLQFSKAIELFDQSLKFDNRNKLTFLARAYANFELRNFDEAQKDYENAKGLEIIPPLLTNHFSYFSVDQLKSRMNRIEFSKGFILGGMEGFNESTKYFIPSMLHTVTGIAQGLWVFAKDPINITHDFIDAANIFVLLVEKHISEEDLLDETVSELKDLLDKWLSLSDFEKGRQIGFIISKYGVEILFTAKSIQIIRQFRELKYAHGELTLKALEKHSNRKLILDQAEKRAKARKILFKDGKIRISWGDQNKHFLDSPNYIQSRSYFTILREKLEELIGKYAGSGRACSDRVIGEIGYREIVDFEEIIGVYIKKNENGVILFEKPTRMGTIHYKKDGSLHIVPANPDQW